MKSKMKIKAPKIYFFISELSGKNKFWICGDCLRKRYPHCNYILFSISGDHESDKIFCGICSSEVNNLRNVPGNRK